MSPSMRGVAAQQQQVVSGTDPNLAGLRILLAEDGRDNQELIRLFLSRIGAEVEVVDNGRLAVAKAEAQFFDVILMDMNMPEMDGYEAVRTLRGRGYARPILALTANAMPGDSERSLAAGCNAHLTKPIDRSLLVRTIAKHATEPGEGEVVVSLYADDPEMAIILEAFVWRLGGQVSAMGEALADRRYDDLRRLAHGLKGAGGGYGYPALSDASKTLEDAATAGDSQTAALAIDNVARLCRAIENAYATSPRPPRTL